MSLTSLRLTVAGSVPTLNGEPLTSGHVLVTLDPHDDDDKVGASLCYCKTATALAMVPTDPQARRVVLTAAEATTVGGLLDAVVTHLDGVLGAGVVTR